MNQRKKSSEIKSKQKITKTKKNLRKNKTSEKTRQKNSLSRNNTQKFNENAKKVIFSQYFLQIKKNKFFWSAFLSILKKNFGGPLARATSLYIRKTFRGPLAARGAILWPRLAKDTVAVLLSCGCCVCWVEIPRPEFVRIIYLTTQSKTLILIYRLFGLVCTSVGERPLIRRSAWWTPASVRRVG